MATAPTTYSASTGQGLNDDGTPVNPQATPAQLQQYVQNMGNVMQWLTQQSAGTQPGTPSYALAAQTQGLKAQQAGLATPNAANPLNFLFQGSGYATPGIQGSLASLNTPGILSTENQATQAANQAGLVNQTITAQEQNQIAAYTASKNAGIGANTIGQIPGSLAQYSYDSRTGIFTNLSTGTQSSTPPPSNATPQEINTTQTGMQSYAKNYYQTNSTPQPEMTPAGGVGTVQGDWTFDGTQWQLTPSSTTQAAAINSYIKDHSKGSPISGLMVLNAATNAGIDPWKLAATLANQSDFGTTGDNSPQNQSWTLTVNDIANQLAKPQTSNVGPITKTPAPPTSDPIDLLAWQVLNGMKSPSEAKSNVGDVPSGDIALNNSLVKQAQAAGFTYDEGATQGKFDAKQGSINTQTTTVNDLSAARQSVGNIANSLITQLTGSSDTLNPSILNLANKLIQAIAGQTSNPQYQTLMNRMTDIASTYSGILTPGGNTDSTRSMAQGLVDQLAKGSSIQKVIADLDQQAQEKISGVQANIQNIASGNNTNPLTSFINSAIPSVIPKGTDGSNYGFPGYVSDGTQWVKK